MYIRFSHSIGLGQTYACHMLAETVIQLDIWCKNCERFKSLYAIEIITCSDMRPRTQAMLCDSKSTMQSKSAISPYFGKNNDLLCVYVI